MMVEMMIGFLMTIRRNIVLYVPSRV